ncbi:MAG: glycosyl transferase [Nitrospinae bacterium]|nr:glycosyl transferase [Nitrospinota bacterium]
MFYSSNMLNFCTYFDSNYLVKGLALYRSLVRHAMPFRLWVLCFDNPTYEILQKLSLPQVNPILLSDFEHGDEQLLKAKGNRLMIEYYFTCTSSLPLYIFKNYSDVDIITYIDADLFFFSKPSPIYEEMGGNSVLIIGHRFPSSLSHLKMYGIYNVGFLSFRRDDAGLACLSRWREQCLEWCYDRVEDGRFSDQKYLDDWPTNFSRVAVLQHKGAGLSPWNLANYHLEMDNGQVVVDNEPLIFFHFHDLKQLRQWLYDPCLTQYGICASSFLKRYIYGP